MLRGMMLTIIASPSLRGYGVHTSPTCLRFKV